MNIVLGLGSNLGDREEHLRRAIASLEQRQVRVLQSASLYITEPRDITDQPWFINTVFTVETQWRPMELLAQCLEVEREAGRVRTFIGGPRPLDIDILFYGSLEFRAEGLIIPHPRYADRRFVLVPLVELAPEYRDPVRGQSMRELLKQCTDTGEVRLYAAPLL